MTGAAILADLQQRFAGSIVDTHDQHGDHTVVVARGALVDLLRYCRDEPALAFDMLTDLTAVDYLKYPGREDGARFEVVYHLYSLGHNHRLRVKVRVEEDDAVVPTAVPSGPSPTGSSARCGTCSACASRGTRTCAASSCTRSSSATRCARTTRSTGASRLIGPRI